MTTGPEPLRGIVLATVGLCMLIYLLPSSRLTDSLQTISRRANGAARRPSRLLDRGHSTVLGRDTELAVTSYAVAGLVVVGFALRYYQAGVASFWMDEFYSVFVRGDRPVAEIVLTPTQDSHPPLYYVLLHFWMELGGNSEHWVRLLSVVVGTLSIPSLYLLGKTMFNERIGFVTALLYTISPFAVYQSQLARMYVLLMLLTILSVWAFWRLRAKQTRRAAVIYVACTVPLLWTHLYAIFVVLAQNLFVLAEWRTKSSDSRETTVSFGKWLRIQAVTAVLAAPLLVNTLRLVGQVVGPSEGYVGWIPQPTIEMLSHVVFLYGGLPDFHPFYAVNELTKGSALLVVAVFGLSLCIWIASQSSLEVGNGSVVGGKRQVPFLLLLAGMAVILPFVLSALLTPMFIPRYSVLGLVPFYFILALGVTSLPGRDLRRVVLAVLILSSAVTLNGYYQAETQEPWKPSLEYIDSRYEQSDSVLINPGWAVTEETVREYTSIPPANTRHVLEGTPKREIRSKLPQSRDRVWIISYDASSTELIREGISDSHALAQKRQFGLITVYLYTADTGPKAVTDATTECAMQTPLRCIGGRRGEPDMPRKRSFPRSE